MNLNSDVKELLECFNAYRVKYLVVGAYAYGFHVQPRCTKDFDVWVRADRKNAASVYRALKEFGAPLERYTASDFAEERYFYRMGAEPNAIDVMMSVKGLSFDEAWENRVEVDYHGTRMQVVSKQDLLKAKLAAGRNKDLRDADGLRDSLGWEHLPKKPIVKKRTTRGRQRTSGRRGRVGPRREKKAGT